MNDRTSTKRWDLYSLNPDDGIACAHEGCVEVATAHATCLATGASRDWCAAHWAVAHRMLHLLDQQWTNGRVQVVQEHQELGTMRLAWARLRDLAGADPDEDLGEVVEGLRARASLGDVVNEILLWQEATFPYATIDGAVQHLLREANELAMVAHDRSEVGRERSKIETADVVFLAIQVFTLLGGGMVAALRAKLLKNRARHWAPPQGGLYEHVRGVGQDDTDP